MSFASIKNTPKMFLAKSLSVQVSFSIFFLQKVHLKNSLQWNSKILFIKRIWHTQKFDYLESVSLVVCDLSVNELWVTLTHRDPSIDQSRSLTDRSKKGRTQPKIRPQVSTFLNTQMYVRYHFQLWKIYLGMIFVWLL